MTRNLIYLALLIGFGIQIVNMYYSGLEFLSIIPILFLAGWFFSHRFQHYWLIHITFIADIGLLAWISFFSLATWTLIISALCILISWDLTHFQKILIRSNPKNNIEEVENQHLVKLGIFSILSLVLTIGAMFIRIRISFLQSIVLLIIAFVGLMQVSRWLLQQYKTSKFFSTSVTEHKE